MKKKRKMRNPLSRSMCVVGVSLAEVGALIPKLLLPFNAIKAVLNASLTLCLYKPLTSVLKRTGFGKKTPNNTTEQSEEVTKINTKTRTILVWTIGAIIAIISMCIIFFVLGGTVAIN
ncbi:MAG: hypothetical protein IKJ00_06445 [Clostridia bacterium]|nr:hypothetical protein [Clostridia bacterium]